MFRMSIPDATSASPARADASDTRSANVIIAANIRGLLGYRNLPNSALALHLGQNEMWLSRRLNNHTEFSANEISKIAKYFAIEPGYLFEEKQPRAGATGTAQITGLVRPRGWKLPRLDSNQEPIGFEAANDCQAEITYLAEYRENRKVS